ncbi:MAG: acetyltransferase [Flavobacterium sp.]
MKKKILLFGASDHCRYTIDIVENENQYHILGIIDKNLQKGEEIDGYPVLGYFDDLENLFNENEIFGGIVSIGDNYTRKKVANEILLRYPDFNFVNAVHTSVIIGKNTVLGNGCVLMAGVIINNDCNIGDHCFLATKSSLDHDSCMGDFSSLSPGVTTGGRVGIGECSAIGIGASILHYTTVGSNCVIGGNALVNKDVEDNFVAYGVPAKVVRKRELGEKYL